MPSSPVPHHYRLFGLSLQSDIALPELVDVSPGGAPDVVIARGAVVLPEGGPVVAGLRVGADGAVLNVKGVALFGIADGRRITVDAAPDASDRDIRLFLLGSAFGVVLIQRRILPLHANAIDLGGRAIGFLGHSGSGKSTLAAAFHDHGWRVLSDDVCAVTRSDDGFLAQPGIPRLRLWRDAIERSGREVEGYERAFHDRDKYTVGIAGDAIEAVPLTALYVLTSGGDDFTVRRLAGGEAVDALMANTYRGAFVKLAGDSAAYFQTCLALANAVPVFELRRPWDGARVGETVAHIEAQLATLA